MRKEGVTDQVAVLRPATERYSALSLHAVKPRESHAILRSELYVTPRFSAFT